MSSFINQQLQLLELHFLHSYPNNYTLILIMKINTHLTEDAQGNPLYLSNDDGEQIYTFPSPDHIVLRPGSYEVPEIYHFTQEEEDELFDKETASCWEMLAVRWEVLAVRSHYEFMTDEQ